MQQTLQRRHVICMAIAASLAAGISGCGNNKAEPKASPPSQDKALVKPATAEAGPAVWKFQPTGYPENIGITKGMQVEETKKGFSFKAMEDGATVAMITSLSGSIEKVFPDALGSTNIHVKVNARFGHTTLAGLKFTKACVINVRKDGTVEADQEGIEASTAPGVKYISRKVAGLGAIVMVEAEKK